MGKVNINQRGVCDFRVRNVIRFREYREYNDYRDYKDYRAIRRRIQTGKAKWRRAM